MSYLPLAPAAAVGDRLLLPEGRALRVRRLEASDRSGLEALFARLSDESRRRRFLHPKPTVTSAELRYLTEVDGARHGALAVVDEDSGELVAEARYAAWHDREDTADVAVTVADELHGRRIGSALMAALTAWACAGGFARLTGSTLLENAASLAMLRRAGFRTRERDGSVLELELDLTGCGC